MTIKFIEERSAQLGAVMKLDRDAALDIIAAFQAMRDLDYIAMTGNIDVAAYDKNLRVISELIVRRPAFAMAILESLELVEIATMRHFKEFANKIVREKRQESLLDRIKRQAAKRIGNVYASFVLGPDEYREE